MPYTFWAMMIGTLAITGVGIPLLYIGFPVGFAGFISKDAVIEVAWAGSNAGFAFWTLLVAAAMTSFYSWRLMFLTFYGAARGDKHTHEHAHESPKVMLAPLGVLALGAILAGMIWYKPFFGDNEKVAKFFNIPEAVAEAEADAGDAGHDDGYGHFAFGGVPGDGAIYIGPENHVLDDAHAAPAWVKVSPFVAMLMGLALAFQMYIRRPDLPAKLAENQRPLYLFLLNKWYFDEIYDAVFVKPAVGLGRLLWRRGDGNVIDGGINGVALGIIPFFTRQLGRLQSGYIFTYAFLMVLGIALMITWFTIFGGAN
jgi:NADH-quinone oxidoreductase subunit L